MPIQFIINCSNDNNIDINVNINSNMNSNTCCLEALPRGFIGRPLPGGLAWRPCLGLEALHGPPIWRPCLEPCLDALPVGHAWRLYYPCMHPLLGGPA